MQSCIHAKKALECRNGHVAINSRHGKLITALRTAVENGEGMLDKEAENGEGMLDKEATSHDDLFDAFRMSL